MNVKYEFNEEELNLMAKGMISLLALEMMMCQLKKVQPDFDALSVRMCDFIKTLSNKSE